MSSFLQPCPSTDNSDIPARFFSGFSSVVIFRYRASILGKSYLSGLRVLPLLLPFKISRKLIPSTETEIVNLYRCLSPSIQATLISQRLFSDPLSA